MSVGRRSSLLRKWKTWSIFGAISQARGDAKSVERLGQNRALTAARRDASPTGSLKGIPDMFSVKWHQRRVTDSSKRILEQISSRAIDRGLALSVADQPSIVMLALVGASVGAKTRLSGHRTRGWQPIRSHSVLDQSLQRKASELPVAFDMDREVGRDNPQRGVVVVSEPDQPFVRWDSEDLLEPLLRLAKDECRNSGTTI